MTNSISEQGFLKTAMYGDLASFVTYIEADKVDVNVIHDGYTDTALMIAAQTKNMEILEFLLEYKDELNVDLNIEDANGYTALDLARTDEIKDLLIVAGAKHGSHKHKSERER